MTQIPRRIRAAPRHVTRRRASAGLQTKPLGNEGPFQGAQRDSRHSEALFRAGDRRPATTGTPKFLNSGRVPPSTVHEHGFRIAPHYKDTASDADHREGMIRVSGVVWYTNIDHNKRHEELILVKRYHGNEAAYPSYDNYDAIEVSRTQDIPMDYAGTMDVPLTFLDKHNPDQFEIIGTTQSWCDGRIKTYPRQVQIGADGRRSDVTKLNDGAAMKVTVQPHGKTCYLVDDAIYVKVYARILIRRKTP